MDFSFIQITDHHLTSTAGELLKGYSTHYAFRQVLRHIAQNVGPRVDFIVSTGDVVNDPSAVAYQTFLQTLNAQGAALPGPLTITTEGLESYPLYVLPGNHDDREHFFKCLFPQSPPGGLMNATFIHKGVQFICLDWGPEVKATAHPEMLKFLAHALATPLPAIILMHHQVVPMGVAWLDNFIADDVEQFWPVLAGHNILGILCGHIHMTYEKVLHGIPIFGLRATAFSFLLQDEPVFCLLPPHYRLVTVQNGLLTTRIFEVPL